MHRYATRTMGNWTVNRNGEPQIQRIVPNRNNFSQWSRELSDRQYRQIAFGRRNRLNDRSLYLLFPFGQPAGSILSGSGRRRYFRPHDRQTVIPPLASFSRRGLCSAEGMPLHSISFDSVSWIFSTPLMCCRLSRLMARALIWSKHSALPITDCRVDADQCYIKAKGMIF